jgi:RNA polymerase sigma-70 factor (family 1)
MTTSTEILPNETDLFRRIAGGDEAAFRQIFQHYTQRIYPFILKRTRSEDITEELVQEIFIKIWNNRTQLAQVENHSSYIFTMAAHKIYAHFRKTAADERLIRDLLSRIEEIRSTTEDLIDLKESELLIGEAVAQLPSQRKKIYELSRVQGLSHVEIARHLNISPSTVNNQLTEALRQIRQYLRQHPGASLTLIVVLLRHGG